jgi:sigma-B regulation protein RsbU (phosphoserine phosphatase)
MLVHRGVVVFVLCSLYNHITGIIGHGYHNVEPFGFVVLICCLGFVGARRTLMQEQQFRLIQKELEIARQIQFSILPKEFPASASFQVSARYVPMTSVAGDFYDFLPIDAQRAGILIADVSGHGVPAALIASMVKLAAATQSANAAQPAELLRRMNASLCGNVQSQFVTAAYVYLDAAASELRYAAAGHPAMLILRNREVTSVTENGLMLAAFTFADYTMNSRRLLHGDRIVLYTDGILEAANAGGEEFGSARLCALVKQTSDLSPSEAADRIIETIQGWAPIQDDDLTVVVCDAIA